MACRADSRPGIALDLLALFASSASQPSMQGSMAPHPTPPHPPPFLAEYSSSLSDFLDTASLHNLTAARSLSELAQALHGMEDSFCTPEK